MCNQMAQPIRHGKLSGMRVLVAEDVWIYADTLSVILEEQGAVVLGPCNTVAKALEIVRHAPIDFALVDMGLADAFADNLVAEINARDIPYAIVTGYQNLPTNADANAAGVLKKPLNAKALVDLLADFAEPRPA